MPFIGNQPALSYTSFAKQDFTTSATTSYTLDNPVANANELALFINFVRQEPGSYSASGTTLTLTEARSSSDDMYAIFLGKAIQTVNPPNASVGTSQLADNGVTTAKIANDAVTKDKVSNLMYPAFEARISGNQSVNHATFTKVQCNDEIYDTDNAYDNSTNYRFNPQVAGKYFCYFGARGFAGGSDPDGVRFMIIAPYKNGSLVRDYNGFDSDPNEMRHMELTVNAVVELNGSSDYLEFFGYVYAENLSSSGVVLNSNQTYFGAYRIGD